VSGPAGWVMELLGNPYRCSENGCMGLDYVSPPPSPPSPPPIPTRPPLPPGWMEACDDDCYYAADGECDDGGPGSSYDMCIHEGHDCTDCGIRYFIPA